MVITGSVPWLVLAGAMAVLLLLAVVRVRSIAVADLRRSSRTFELSRDLTVTVGLDGNYKSVNPALEHVLGWRAEEFLARPFIDMVHSEDRAATLAELAKLADGQATVGFVNRYEAKDGSHRWLDWHAVLPPDEKLIYAAARDVTDSKLATLALAASEHTTRRILETAHDAFVAIDASGVISDWNPEAEAMFGWSREEALGRELGETIVPESYRDAHRRGMARFVAGGETRVIGKLLALSAIHRDGREFPVELTISSVETEDGYTFNAFLRDISERRGAEDEMQRNRRLLADLLDSAPDAVVIADERGQITLVNEQTERLFGYVRAELIGAPVQTLLPQRCPTHQSTEGAHHLEVPANTLMGVGLELVGRRRDGTEFPVDISLSAIKTREGRLVTAFVRDTTERKRTQDELAAAHEKALEASRLKSEFVANMSHEIRTPLNGVLGMSGLLLDTDLSAEQREYAEAVRVSGDALMTVVDDILDFSKIEAGKLELERKPFDLRELVEDACAILATAANEKGVELMISFDDGLPERVSGDGPRLRQVIINLVTNAVKFTPAGDVVVHVGEHPAEGERSLLRFEVRDTGIGIEQAALENIFDAFSQADSSTTRRYGGTGLGLAICKQLVGLMGGAIAVRSTPGRGSTFWFTAALDAAQSDAPAQLVGLDDVRVLVVDDNATNRAILERQLVSWGMACTTAADGPAALAALCEATEAGRPHQLVVLDASMAKMSGLELAGAISATTALRSLRMVMLISSGSAVRPAARLAGVCGFVTKPVRQSRLGDEMTRVLGAASPRPRPKAAAAVAVTSTREIQHIGDPSQRPVLVADDVAVNRLVAARLLQKRGFAVDTAADGREALEKHADGRYEFIFMDCQMPELDGYQATVEIRRREGAERHTPIIAMTAHTMKGDRERCLSAGMDDYLAKPLQPVLLDEILARGLWPRDPQSGAGFAEGDDEWLPVLDPSLLADICDDGDDDMREQLIAMFLEQARAATTELAGALAAGDAGSVKRTAHALKGSSAVLGAKRLSAAAAALGESAAAGRLTDAHGQQAELERVYAMTAAAFNSADASGAYPDRIAEPINSDNR